MVMITMMINHHHHHRRSTWSTLKGIPVLVSHHRHLLCCKIRHNKPLCHHDDGHHDHLYDHLDHHDHHHCRTSFTATDINSVATSPNFNHSLSPNILPTSNLLKPEISFFFNQEQNEFFNNGPARNSLEMVEKLNVTQYPIL